MKEAIKEELQEIIQSSLISSEEELSDAELESVAGGVTISGTGSAGLRVAGFTLIPLRQIVSGTLRLCSPSTVGIPIPILGGRPVTFIESFSR